MNEYLKFAKLQFNNLEDNLMKLFEKQDSRVKLMVVLN